MAWRFRSIWIFVEPEALTVDNARAIFRQFSEQYPTEAFGIEVLTDDEQVREAESWLSMARRFPFGNVPPAICGLGLHRVSADFHRSDLTEYFGCYSCRGSGGQPILEHLRNPSQDCEVRGEDPADLLEAANRGCKDAAEWLLNRGLDPNVKAPYGGVPLVEAALWGRAEIVRLLLERGASVNLATSSGWTALMAAAFRRGSGTTIDLLLRHGAALNVHSQDGTTALMLAAQHQDSEVVKELIAWGADADAVDGYGNTVLSYADGDDKAEKFKLLTEAGADR